MHEDILIRHNVATLTADQAKTASRKIIKEPKMLFKPGLVVILDGEQFNYEATIRNIDKQFTIHQFIYVPKQSKILKVN